MFRATQIALWADVVLNPSFPDAEIERKRQQTLGRIFEKGDPGARGAHHANLLYGDGHNTPATTGSGTSRSVKAFARDDLVNYHRAWFKPNNATLVVTGDTTLKEIAAARKGLRRVEAGRDAENRRPAARTAEADGRLYDRQARSGAIGHHRRPPARSAQRPDTTPFEVLNAILGGQFTSRLNMNLREERATPTARGRSRSWPKGKASWACSRPCGRT